MHAGLCTVIFSSTFLKKKVNRRLNHAVAENIIIKSQSESQGGVPMALNSLLDSKGYSSKCLDN